MYRLTLDWIEQNWQKQGRFWESSTFDNSSREMMLPEERQNGKKNRSHNWKQINTYRNTGTWRRHWSRCWNRQTWKETWTDHDMTWWHCGMTWYDIMIHHDLAKNKWALKGQGYVPVPETTPLWQSAQSTSWIHPKIKWNKAIPMLMLVPKVNYLLFPGCLILHHSVATVWNWEQKEQAERT